MFLMMIAGAPRERKKVLNCQKLFLLISSPRPCSLKALFLFDYFFLPPKVNPSSPRPLGALERGGESFFNVNRGIPESFTTKKKSGVQKKGRARGRTQFAKWGFRFTTKGCGLSKGKGRGLCVFSSFSFLFFRKIFTRHFFLPLLSSDRVFRCP